VYISALAARLLQPSLIETIMRAIAFAGILFCFLNTTKGQTNDNIRPFEVSISNADYSMAYSLLTILTHKEIRVIFQGGLQGEKDSLVFSKLLQPSDTVRQISAINLRKLKAYYSNQCINDGSQVTITLKKGGETKTVHVSNYYQEDIGKIIYLMNTLVPEKYKVWYDKEQLIAKYKKCNEKK
jgi:hypothetical protein